MKNIKTFNSYSFGCRVNHAEREEIDRQLVQAGLKQVENNPDIFIINTCCVTNEAERSARKLIYHVRRTNPLTKIVITGCSVTYWLKHNLYKDLPVEICIDNVHKEFLVALILKKIGKPLSKKIVSNSSIDKYISSGRLVIKIQDGCHRFCTFCIVPYLRGLPKSEKINDIVQKINLHKGKLHEVILTAINTEAFGLDTGEHLTDLVTTIMHKTTIPRISFGSIHPWSLDDTFLSFYKQPEIQKRFVHFFHIPLQSGSNKILQLMKRVHTREDMLKRTKKIALINPYAFLATDIIVGFLGEEKQDFNDTYTFLEKSPIVKFHVFRYSERFQTAAHFMAKKMKEPSDSEKKERSLLLRELSHKKTIQFYHSLVGYTSMALVLQKKVNGQSYALLNNQIDVLLHKRINNNRIIPVRVVDYDKGKLIARTIE